jgi:predicted nucleic-acid-binding Zn-ribbon protein
MRTDYVNFFDPKDNSRDKYYSRGVDLYVKEIEDNLFHIGQSYDKHCAKTLVCKKCGGKEFNVGTGNHYTAIRCINCEYEVCVHNG